MFQNNLHFSSIFQQSGSFINAYYATITIGIIRVIFACLVSYFFKYEFSRRNILTYSFVVCSLSLTAFGLGIEFRDSLPSWFIMPWLFTFVASFALTAAIPYMLLAELFRGKKFILHFSLLIMRTYQSYSVSIWN